MGEVRGRHYDAVIGVGGIGSEAQSYGISGRINWVGIGPKKDRGPVAQRIDPRGPLVQFDKFRLWEDKGPLLQVEAPLLARRFYEKKARWVLDGFSRLEYEEALAILKLVDELQAASLTDSTSRLEVGTHAKNPISDVTGLVVSACRPSEPVGSTLDRGHCSNKSNLSSAGKKKNC